MVDRCIAGIVQSQFGAHDGQPLAIVLFGEGLDDCTGSGDCPFAVGVDQWQQGFRKAGEIPLRYRGLSAIGVAITPIRLMHWKMP